MPSADPADQQRGEATLVRCLDGYNGDARLFKLSPPLEWHNYSTESTREVAYVVVSAANVWGCGPETYIFPADETGEVINWMELCGSFKGGLDHARALRGAGYEVRHD